MAVKKVKLPKTDKGLTSMLLQIMEDCVPAGLKFEVALVKARRRYLLKLERALKEGEEEEEAE